MTSELTTHLNETLRSLAASDPRCKRFGAAQHRYQLAPPAASLPLDVPDDYREYVTHVSAGGAGPYYGLVPVERAAGFVVGAPAQISAWQRALPIAHLGCGYAALLVLDGPAAGQIWLDARPLDILAPIRPSFTAFVLDWLDRVANQQWLDGFVPPGECAITSALSGYLGVCEQRLGVEPGTLDGAPLQDALAALGPGAIEVTADRPLALFAEGDRLDPCATCARALQGLADRGLRQDVVRPGTVPLPVRGS